MKYLLICAFLASNLLTTAFSDQSRPTVHHTIVIEPYEVVERETLSNRERLNKIIDKLTIQYGEKNEQKKRNRTDSK